MSWPNDPKKRAEYPFASFKGGQGQETGWPVSNNAQVTPDKQSTSGSDNMLKAILQELTGLRQILQAVAGQPKAITLPDHLYIPEGAQSIDIENVFDVTAGTSQEILRFECPAGSVTKFLFFAIFNDGALASDFDFIPTVDGRRVYPYHGDPLDNFRIYLGVAPDVSNVALRHAPLTLQPGQVLSWLAINNAVVDTTMGVRMVGYVDSSQARKQIQFG